MNNKEDFSRRFKEAFNGIPNKDIAELLGVSKASITLYTSGRLPPSEMLLVVAEKTGCNLHWLMTGHGPKWAQSTDSPTKRAGEVIALYHSAGGTGKSVAASFLAMSLARRGYRTLLVETFEELSPSSLFFPQLSDIEYSPSRFSEIYGRDMARRFFKTPVDRLDLHAGSISTRSKLLELKVKNFLTVPSEVLHKYSFIIMDVKSRDLLDESDMFKARLMLSAKVLISCDAYRADTGIEDCFAFLKRSLEQSDEISVLGAFANKASLKSHSLMKTLFEINLFLPGGALNTVIRRDTNYLNSRMNNLAIYDLSPRAKIVKDYEQLAEEIILRTGITEK